MKEIWRRIADWLRTHAPSFSLPDGASETEISRAEKELGYPLPKDVRDSYRIHNGSNRIWLFEQGCLMPLYRPADLPKRHQARFKPVIGTWQAMNELQASGGFDDPGFVSKPEGPIKSDWWNTGWIPISDNQCGDALCVDVAPKRGGHRGQIIDWWHEAGATRVVAKNFRELLSELAATLESNQFVFCDKGAGSIKDANTV